MERGMEGERAGERGGRKTPQGGSEALGGENTLTTIDYAVLLSLLL